MSTGIAGRYIETRLGKPSLIRDTSRRTVMQSLSHPIQTMRRVFTSTSAQDALKGALAASSAHSSA